jgi:glycine/D-amino acid oxidase-like deaminating enzyme
VHPARFTETLMCAAQEAGAELVTGEVKGLSLDDAGAVRGATVDGAEIAADRVVLAMGPWSIRAAGWLDLPVVHAVKGHSLVFSAADVPAEALFLEHRDAEGRTASPEVFPRADGTVYACAISSESPLPDNPAETNSDAGAIERLEDICRAISPELSPDRVIARQACHRPVTRDGLPLLGPVPGTEGAIVATGHGVWGTLNAPATGEAVAELILDETSRTVYISPFDPGRLPHMRPGGRHPVTARRTLGRHGATRERK